MSKENTFKTLAEKWPSAFVARQEVAHFSGGIINCKTIANLDCQGKGPAGRVRIGRKILKNMKYSLLATVCY